MKKLNEIRNFIFLVFLSAVLKTILATAQFKQYYAFNVWNWSFYEVSAKCKIGPDGGLIT